MRNLIFAILLSFISGCSNIDKQQALNDCKFGAVKAGHKIYDDRYIRYIFSCMNANGYVLGGNEDEGCSDSIEYGMATFCWEYSWRVFLH